MPRPTIDLDEFRDEIHRRIIRNESYPTILTWLSQQGLDISMRTFNRRVVAWGINPRVSTSTEDPDLLEIVNDTYHSTFLSDEAIASAAISQGVATTARQVKRVRLAHGWRRRDNMAEQQDEQQAETFAIIAEALQEGTIRCYGRQYVRTYLSVHLGHRARDDDVRDALFHLDPVGTAARRPDTRRRHRGEYIVSGPDFVWSMDGHDKFRNYGIEIYGIIDGYSRRVLSIYVGNSNRTQVSVAKQWLDLVAAYGKRPKFVRTDRGVETLMAADAQYSFYLQHQRLQGLSSTQVDTLPFRDCYLYGTSTANIRIESFWNQLQRQQTKPWRVSFKISSTPWRPSSPQRPSRGSVNYQIFI